MDALWSATVGYLPLTLAALVLVLLAPSASPRMRGRLAAVLALGAVACIAIAALLAGTTRTTEIVNPFFDPEHGAPVPFVVDTATSAAWLNPMVAALALAVPAVLILLTRGRPSDVRHPVRIAIAVTLWAVVSRLAFEKTAAPEGLVWATGVTIANLAILPFYARWLGTRGATFGRLVVGLLALGVLQRVTIVVIGLLATTMQLGTHLDVHAIERVNLLVGEREFTDGNALRQWFTLIAFPQFVLWVPITLVTGLLLGTLPWWFARHRR